MLAKFLTLLLLLLVFTGCVHHIEVHPSPASQATMTVAKSLQVVVDAPLLEGADHRPGIALLKWPQKDLQQAVIRYAQLRGTFSVVSAGPAELKLRITTKLLLASQQGRYHYRIRLQGEMSESNRLINTYLAEAVARGSRARWVTASDRDPIESALQSALNDLFTKIEGDHSPYPTDKPEPPLP